MDLTNHKSYTIEDQYATKQIKHNFFPSFYSFNILTKDDSLNFKKPLKNIQFSYYLHDIWVQVPMSYKHGYVRCRGRGRGNGRVLASAAFVPCLPAVHTIRHLRGWKTAEHELQYLNFVCSSYLQNLLYFKSPYNFISFTANYSRSPKRSNIKYMNCWWVHGSKNRM